MLSKVKKRDGKVESFDRNRINEAILKAMKAVGKENAELSDVLSRRVTELLELTVRRRIPGVEEIQDLVEKVLIEAGCVEIARAYIIYREEHARIRKAKEVFIDVSRTINGYLDFTDWRARENANADFSFSGLMMHSASAVIANYTLDSIYSHEVANAHRDGDFHIHDLAMGIAGYCAGWNLRQILAEGFNGVPRKVEAAPPKHFETALGQMVNFLGTLQNEWAGAMAFNSFDTYLAPYVKKDNLTYAEVKQSIQRFIFSLNVASRWGGQTPFSNLTFDWEVPDDLKDEKVTMDGEYQSNFGTYKEFKPEMDTINRAFIEVMIEGDMNNRVFTFPIPTYNLTRDFDYESRNAYLLFKMTGKYGLPYFQNFVNSDLNPQDVRAMCCRLQLNLAELRKNITGGLFGSSESTGSIGVVTINMPRIGYLAKTEDEFLNKLSRLMELAQVSLETKRKLVTKNIETGLFPYTRRYLKTLRNHFATIGLVGMNEACLNLIGKDIGTNEGREFAKRVIDFMLQKLRKFQEETGNIYNLEATPAEATAYRLAKIDKQRWPDIIAAGKNAPYYTNSTQLPVNYTDDIFETFELQEELQNKYTGGTVLHGFIGEEIKDPNACALLVRRLAESFKVPYFTITPTFSICPTHGYVAGKQEICPTCGATNEIYSRVVGYYRPVANWNEGKQEEFSERIEYRLERPRPDTVVGSGERVGSGNPDLSGVTKPETVIVQ
ncbi:MAG: ribonucleoside triphosphate reductase [Candidatus Stahlbacteria bacterium]|nr:ribonucleoside triphosphate reductase [Candidatus Stahlbacteria bacterium]